MLSQITWADSAQLHSKISRHSPVTANRVLALVSSIFGRAIERGLWDGINPASHIKHNPERDRHRFLPADELPRYFQVLADEPNATIREFFLVSVLTGARRSNALGECGPQSRGVAYSRNEERFAADCSAIAGSPSVRTPLCGLRALDALLPAQGVTSRIVFDVRRD